MTPSNSNPSRPAGPTWMPLALGVGGVLCGPAAWANPQGLTVVSGAATRLPAGSSLTILVSDRAVLNWQSFNIAAGQATIFQQPNAASIVWNQVLDKNPSHLFGRLEANGIVVLANQAGFWFGPDSVVKAASFVATTASGPPPNLEAGGAWNLSYAPPLASIINYGTIEAGPGGSIFLVAEKVENHGVMLAPDGNIGLYAGKEVLVSERPDGRGLSAKISLPEGSVDNHGRLIADAGSIALHAQVVNQNGWVQANSIRERSGVIELLATEAITLGAGSQTLAQGEASGLSPGGQITIKSDLAYHDAPTARVSVAGGAAGGGGGQVEISADNLPDIRAVIDGSAASGFTAGELLIDPNSIVISAAGTGTSNSGTVGSGALPNQLTISPSAFAAFSQINLQARTTIEINTIWSLPDTAATGARLTLEAGTDLRFGSAGGIDAGTGWSVELTAGKNSATTTGNRNDVTSGLGSVFVNTATVAARDGNVVITAGKDVTVTRGAVRTTGGGSIDVKAQGGSINTGTGTAGYSFAPSGVGYTVSPGLSGMSTAAGGNVTLEAGKDVTSFLPTGNTSLQDAGSGAFGPQAGNVTITAHGSVYGHFVVASGMGQITADNLAGDNGNKQLALSLVKGSWAVTAHDITLQEVRNPNGIFNTIGSPSEPTYHLFDYDPEAKVTLKAEKGGVTLFGGALPRRDSVPIFYPPSLAIAAGAAGVTLGANITLFPSSTGQLSITTLDGGGLVGREAGRNYQLLMSDSAARQFTFTAGQFGPLDHGPELLHKDDLIPVSLDLAGDLRNIQLTVPKVAKIKVGGNLVNSTFSGQNLRPADNTVIDVAGDIRNFTDYTFAQLPPDVADPSLALLEIAEPVFGVNLGYDPVTRTVALRNRLTDGQRERLLHFQVLKYLPEFDPLGLLQLDENGLPLTQEVSLLPASVINALFEGSQAVPDGQSLGYQLAGPGTFTVKARNLDLGASRGILTAGPQANPALAGVSPKGADIDVHITGDLTMFSSAIVSKAGGRITVTSDEGLIQVGAAFVAPNSDQAQGIYTSAGSAVSVTAKRDIQLNGSRVATYDGGGISVKSLTGNVDAGIGGLSLQSVEKVGVDAGKVLTFSDYIPGSGILATTFSYGSTTVGDITINTPQGDILARAGGVVQASFNGTPTSGASVKLTAGTKAVGRPGDADYIAGIISKIDASKSGVIGGNVSLDATGDIIGLVFASGNANLTTPQSVTATVLAQGSANVSAGGTVSGTIAGIGSANVSGGSIDASVLSANATTSGATSGQVGFATANVAGATASAAAAATVERKESVAVKDEGEEDSRRRNAARPVLTRTVGRVTVVLPNSPKTN